jgi:hypothetical protein
MPVILGTREEIRKIVVPRPDRRRTGGSLWDPVSMWKS